MEMAKSKLHISSINPPCNECKNTVNMQVFFVYMILHESLRETKGPECGQLILMI